MTRDNKKICYIFVVTMPATYICFDAWRGDCQLLNN